MGAGLAKIGRRERSRGNDEILYITLPNDIFGINFFKFNWYHNIFQNVQILVLGKIPVLRTGEKPVARGVTSRLNGPFLLRN